MSTTAFKVIIKFSLKSLFSGAQGEYAGLRAIMQYFKSKGENGRRVKKKRNF
jgi:glycine cleavage system protein P-like pyridoxal-binding family